MGLVLVEVLTASIIDQMDVDRILESIEEESWITLLKDSLIDGTLPRDKNEWKNISEKRHGL